VASDVPDSPAAPVVAPHQQRRGGIAGFIRRFAVLIIIAWVALVALLSIAVPPLEIVGQMRSVSMSPDYAPAVVAS
jgi:RND superfamily putative drug exporter